MSIEESISKINLNGGVKIICVDCSASTWESKKYREFVNTILADVPKTSTLIIWADICQVIAFRNALTTTNYSNFVGNGTKPQYFINYLKNFAVVHEDDELIVITDGDIGKVQVQTCTKMMEEWKLKFKSVEVHMYNEKQHIDVSVAIPFTLNQNAKVYVDNQIVDVSLVSGEIDFRRYYSQPQLLIDEAKDLRTRVLLKYNGQKTPAVREEIILLRNNMVECMSKDAAWDLQDVFTNVREKIREGYVEKARTELQFAISREKVDDKVDYKLLVLELLQDLLTCVEGDNKEYEITGYVDRLARSALVPVVKMAETEEPEHVGAEYECPIMMDVSSPILLVNEGEPVMEQFKGTPFSKAVLDNPLNLLTNPDAVMALKSRLDSVIGHAAAKGIFSIHRGGELDVPKSPHTQKHVVGAFTFGLDNTHKASNKYTLSMLIFGDEKYHGSYALWMSVIYFCIHGPEYYDMLKEPVREFLKALFDTELSNITLSGLPLPPLIKANVNLSLWFNVNAHKLGYTSRFKDNHPIILMYMTRLLDAIGWKYETDAGEIRMAIKIYRLIISLEKRRRDGADVKAEIRSFYQKWIKTPTGQIVFLDGASDGPAYDGYIERIIGTDGPTYQMDGELDMHSSFNRVTPGQLWFVNAMLQNNINPLQVHPQTFNDACVPLHVTNYAYTEEGLKKNLPPIPVCPLTCRYYSVDLKSGEPWIVESVKRYGPIEGQLSCGKHFVDFVYEKKAYPKAMELIEFMANKEMNAGRTTLPYNVEATVQEVLGHYKEIMSTLKPIVCRSYIVRSMTLENREAWERTHKIEVLNATLTPSLIDESA